MDMVEKKEYFFLGDTGNAAVTVYTVFPGIDFAYNSIHVDFFAPGDRSKGNYIEIHHCRVGRMEQKLDEDHLYLMPGELSIAFRKQTTNKYRFPLHHYHGITITIDLDVVPECFTEFLEDVCVKPMAVAKKLCHGKDFCVLQNKASIERIFSELYSAPKNGRIGYFKVKILELFLLLNEMDTVKEEAAEVPAPQSKSMLAKQAAEYLMEHMSQHITIPELARQFNVSDSYLKNVFKDMFGVPIYSYMRTKKMQIAAKWLIDSDKPIMQIASECGYSNGSKFTAAFQEIMGETPSGYRKKYAKYSD